jgi:hypothetical protein
MSRQAGQLLDRLGFSSELAKVLATAESGLGLDRSMKGLLQKLEEGYRGAGLPRQGPGPAAPALSPGVIEKVLYLSVLRGAIQKATESQHFNLETQINDLWVKLTQVRQNKSNDDFLKLQDMVQKQSEALDMVRQVVEKYNGMARGIIQSIGR